MIVVKLNGGIGAQMIQYSLGRQLSLLYKTDLYLDDSWFTAGNADPKFPRDFKLDRLQTKYKLLDRGRLFWRMRLTNRFKNVNPFVYEVVNEADYSRFDETVLQKGNNVFLDGYWNSYKYFENIQDTLAVELQPKALPDEQNQRYLDKIKQRNAVSIHFRRGDYAKSTFHGVLTKDYYETALRIIKEKVDDPFLFLFSDEPRWVTSNFQFDLPYEVVDCNGDQNNYWDIQLMKNCKHHIIANSSFSWWGAWLNNRREKIVIAPKIWIAEGNKPMNDFVPERWIRI